MPTQPKNWLVLYLHAHLVKPDKMDNRKTWFLDFDGTLVFQNSHMSDNDQILPSTINFFKKFVKEEDYVVITTARNEKDHKDRIKLFMNENNLKCDLVICGLPTGPRILINDKKNDGTKTAYSFNLDRDQGVKELEIV